MTLHVAAFDQLSAATLYGLLRLRMQVFIVEQRCPYQDLDGRDAEPATRHLWLTEDDDPVGYLRIVTEPDGARRIGRVCVAPAARGKGLADRLMRELRASRARRHVREEVPFYTGQRRSVAELVAALP